MQMTMRDLKALFVRKTNLFNSEQALTALKESLGDLGVSDAGLEIGRDIAALEEKITHERGIVADQEAKARETLKPIEDDVARIGAMLHYCEGMPWEVAASVLRQASGNSVRQAAYRGMKMAGITK